MDFFETQKSELLSPEIVFVDGIPIKANANIPKKVKKAIPTAAKIYEQQLWYPLRSLTAEYWIRLKFIAMNLKNRAMRKAKRVYLIYNIIISFFYTKNPYLLFVK